MCAKARYLANGDVGEVGMPTKRLATVDIRQVHFNGRNSDGENSVSDGNAGMRVSGRIDDQNIGPRSLVLDKIDQFSFVIGLKTLDLKSRLAGCMLQLPVDLRQGRVTIHMLFPPAQEIEIRTMDN